MSKSIKVFFSSIYTAAKAAPLVVPAWITTVLCGVPGHLSAQTTEISKVVAYDGDASDLLGASISVSGNTMVAGAPLDDHGGGVDAGAAYVHVRWNATSWTSDWKLVASDGQPDDQFGTSVSMSGDAVIVGAPLADQGSGPDAGAAYVYVRSGATGWWTEQAKLVASDGQPLDQFGKSVSICGDTAIVGAWKDYGPSGWEEGSAYVFVRIGTTWTEQARLVASDPRSWSDFGYSVAICGDTAIVGAMGQEPSSGSGLRTGAAYVFVRTGTQWTEQAKLIASDGDDSDRFGASVSISHDTAVVGAEVDDHGGAIDSGSAYVFVRSGTTWAEQAKLAASDPQFGDWFGNSVAVSGDTAVVGAWYDDHAGGQDAGSAYVFVRSGTSWTLQRHLMASDATAWDNFGSSVALSGGTTVVGARYDDTTRGPNVGSAYVFDAEYCQLDLGFQGPGNAVASMCGDGLNAGKSSDYEIAGAPANAAGVLLISLEGFADAAVLGGTLVSFGGFVLQAPMLAGPAGDAAITFTGFGVPFDLVYQSVLLDPAAPKGLAFTGAILAQFGR